MLFLALAYIYPILSFKKTPDFDDIHNLANQEDPLSYALFVEA